MRPELVENVVSVIGDTCAEKANMVAKTVQGVFYNGRLIESEKELRLACLKTQLENERMRLEYEVNIAKMKSENYKATLEYLRERAKEGNLSDAEVMTTWNSYDNSNRSLK